MTIKEQSYKNSFDSFITLNAPLVGHNRDARDECSFHCRILKLEGVTTLSEFREKEFLSEREAIRMGT